jgi:hypothetical protein
VNVASLASPCGAKFESGGEMLARRARARRRIVRHLHADHGTHALSGRGRGGLGRRRMTVGETGGAAREQLRDRQLHAVAHEIRAGMAPLERRHARLAQRRRGRRLKAAQRRAGRPDVGVDQSRQQRVRGAQHARGRLVFAVGLGRGQQIQDPAVAHDQCMPAEHLCTQRHGHDPASVNGQIYGNCAHRISISANASGGLCRGPICASICGC